MVDNILFVKNEAAFGEKLAEIIKIHDPKTQFFVLVDSNTKKHCYPIVKPFLPKNSYAITIKAGEKHKNLDTVQHIWSELIRKNADQHAVLIVLGGGTVSDVGALAASLYKRGIKFINIPTTNLAMTDAAMGGKTAVNFGGFKNTIGNFSEPEKIVIFTQFLSTLPKKQLLNGFAETIKHALIADENLFETLQNTNIFTENDYIQASAHIKQAVVKQDYYEKNIRKTLNYGHTIGHAVEGYFLSTKTPLLHGEAVAMGMVVENFLAVEIGILSQKNANTANDFIYSHYKNDFRPINHELIKKYLKQDKKNKNKIIYFSLITKIGTSVYNQTATEAQLQTALSKYNAAYT